MYLSDQNIAQYINAGKIKIGPDFDTKNIRPVGIRLHLGNELLIAEPNQTVSLSGDNSELHYKSIDINKEEFLFRTRTVCACSNA